MTSKIAKGFSLCTAIIGLLCLLTGIGIAICAWVLNGTLPKGFTYKIKEKDGATTEGETISIGNYWWGGLIYILPGIIGIVAGCTRSVTAMVLYLIFNLICCICSLVVVVLCALVLLVWVTIDNLLQTKSCVSWDNIRECRCTTGDQQVFTLGGGDCAIFMSVQAVIGAMISMAAISCILSFIASYISCCSLCNQESTNLGNIIISGGAGVYQPPPVVVSNTTTYPGYPPQHLNNGGAYPGYPPQQKNNAYPPPPYAQQDGNPSYGQQEGYNDMLSAHADVYPVSYPTIDKANLVNNEFR